MNALIDFEDTQARVPPIVLGIKPYWAPVEAEEHPEPKTEAALDHIRIVKRMLVADYALHAQFIIRDVDTPGPNTTLFIEPKTVPAFPSVEERWRQIIAHRDQWLIHTSSTSTFKTRHQGSFVLQSFVSLSDSTTSAPVIPELEVIGPDPLADYERKYSKPNWDFYGADPITAETIEAARYFLDILPATFGAPHVSPASDGTISLEWVSKGHRKLRKLYLDIGPSYTWKGFWRIASGDHRTILPKPIDLKTEAELAALFKELNE